MVQGIIRALRVKGGGRAACLVVISLLLGACANTPLMTPSQVGEPGAGVRPPSLSPLATDAMHDTAAESLLQSADQAAGAGHDQAASLYLERALRIAPGSSWLYKRIAELRLQEGRARAAEGFARHALRNAPDDAHRYRAGLWELVASCLDAQGHKQ